MLGLGVLYLLQGLQQHAAPVGVQRGLLQQGVCQRGELRVAVRAAHHIGHADLLATGVRRIGLKHAAGHAHLAQVEALPTASSAALDHHQAGLQWAQPLQITLALVG